MDNFKVIKIYNNRTKVFVGYLQISGNYYDKKSSKINQIFTSGSTYSCGISYMYNMYSIIRNLEKLETFDFDVDLNKKNIYKGLKEYYNENLDKILNIKSEKDIFIKIVTLLQEQRRLKIKSF
jgi:hypothetical protein